jgi:hypothetical protein
LHTKHATFTAVPIFVQVPAVPDVGLAVIEEQLEAVAELQEEVAASFSAQVGDSSSRCSSNQQQQQQHLKHSVVSMVTAVVKLQEEVAPSFDAQVRQNSSSTECVA